MTADPAASTRLLAAIHGSMSGSAQDVLPEGVQFSVAIDTPGVRPGRAFG